nr:hypothetical protein [Planomonospora venezuelensis]
MPDNYVYVTEEGVTRHYADGSVDALAWEDVVEVRVVGNSPGGGAGTPAAGTATGAAGDAEADVLYILLDREGQGCVVPRSATDGAFLSRLRYLPDFDLDRLSAAMDAARGSSVVVWRSPDPPSALPDLEYD